MGKRKRLQSARSNDDRLTQIKRLAVIAIFADDQLSDRLVLKGGNALDLVHRVTTRASLDLDFSMANAFAPNDLEAIRGRVEHRLQQMFTHAGYTIFDVRLEEKPREVTPDIVHFWGGYALEFKLISTEKFTQLGGGLEDIRRNAISVGTRKSTRFEIEISKFEYCDGKATTELDGYTIFVYTPQMIVCEKLRAICQQMPEYVRIVKRQPAPRARDFLDIHDTMQQFAIDLNSSVNRELLTCIFGAKYVPLCLLRTIGNQRDFHRQDWPAVEATVRPGVALQPFDSYFDFVLRLVVELEPLGNK